MEVLSVCVAVQGLRRLREVLEPRSLARPHDSTLATESRPHINRKFELRIVRARHNASGWQATGS